MSRFELAELVYRCKIVANELPGLKNRDAILQWMGAWDRGQKGPLTGQFANAKNFLSDEQLWPVRCGNYRKTDIMSHEAALGAGRVENPPPFDEPWHYFCSICGAAENAVLRKNGRPLPNEGPPPEGYDPPSGIPFLGPLESSSRGTPDGGGFNWQKLSELGVAGEAMVDRHLAVACAMGHYDGYDWVSKRDPTADHDFVVWKGQRRCMIEVKSTASDFETVFHISLRELEALVDNTRASQAAIWRIVGVGTESPTMFQLRDAELRKWATAVLQGARSVFAGVEATHLRVSPNHREGPSWQKRQLLINVAAAKS